MYAKLKIHRLCQFWIKNKILEKQNGGSLSNSRPINVFILLLKFVIKQVLTGIGDLNSLMFFQVEFPEARIYEEALNILLYENRQAPDQELMQATSTKGAVTGMSSYTSDEEEERSGLARLRSNKQQNPWAWKVSTTLKKTWLWSMKAVV